MRLPFSIFSRKLSSKVSGRKKRSPRGLRIEDLEDRIVPVVELSSLVSATGVVLNGAALDDNSGWSIRSAGDINGDGFTDVAIGAPGSDVNGSNSGSTYIVFGSANPTGSVDVSALNGTNGFALHGSGGYSGWSVSSAGDINGDGFGDIITSAFFANSARGRSFVVFGKSTPFSASINLSSLNGTDGFALTGAAGGDYSGRTVSGAGDVNGDGFDDVVIGAPLADPNGTSSGAAYVVFGKSSGWSPTLALSTLNGSNGFRVVGAVAGDTLGESVSSAGDMNGDGFDDILVSAPLADINGVDSGAAYVIFGARDGFADSLNVTSLIGSNGFRLEGALAGDRVGGSVSSAGDVNGDGYADIILGAPGADRNSLVDNGAAFVVLGKGTAWSATTNLSSLNGANGFSLQGIANGDQAGFSVSGADLNSDGRSDIVIGAPFADPSGRVNAGQVFVLYGVSSFLSSFNLSSINGTNGEVYNGDTAGGRAGQAVGTGDFNGNGLDDILVGAPFFAPSSVTNAGRSYVVYGTAPNIPPAFSGTSAANTITGTSLDESMYGGAGNDTITGGGGQDVIRAGQGNDEIPITSLSFQVIDGGLGNDTLTFGGPSLLELDLTSTSSTKLTGIEIIDLTAASGGQLTVDPLSVLNMAPFSNTLSVRGGANNEVYLSGGWAETTNQVDGGITYRIFVNGQATLRVQIQAPVYWLDLPLSFLNGTNGFVINGIDLSDTSGSSVSSAGDVNGDGFDDLIIGARLADPNGQSGAGESYVVFGKAGGFVSSLNLSTLDGTNGFVINGIDVNDYSGSSVSSAGDVNGDGFGDLIIGANFGDPNGQGEAGESYVVFGKASGFTASLNLSSLDGTNGFVINGIDSSDFSGGTVRSAGDVNGDGLDDLIIGARFADPNGQSGAGESYVVFGKAGGFTPSLSLSTLDGTNGFVINGIDVDDRSGISVSSAGDVNGDGFDDLIIGAYYGDPAGQNSAGESYVVFGKARGATASLNLSTLDGTNGFVINGIFAGDRSGGSVSSAGDINGDGFDDLIIGARLADPNGQSGAGQSYVVFGKASSFTSSLNLSSLNGTNGFRINGIDADDDSGWSVSSAGDINGDGFDDLVIGARLADPNGQSGAGESYVFFGKANSFSSILNLSMLDGTNGFVISGVDVDDRSGISVSSAGDINGDGFDDLIISAYYGDPNGQSLAGESYVIFGGNFTNQVTSQGTSAGESIAATASTDIIVAGQGNDSITGVASNDVVHGGQGNDSVTVTSLTFRQVDAGLGTDTLVLGGSNLILDLRTTPSSKLTGIEIVDLSTSANSQLTLNPPSVLNMAPLSNTLSVRGGAGNRVNLSGSWAETANQVDGGITYRVFISGQATLRVQNQTPVYFIEVSLSVLNGTNGFVINGIDASDLSGISVGSAGDVNGDGFGDLIIGATGGDPAGQSSAGESYVVFGKASGFTSSLNLSTLDGTTGFVINGIDASDLSGISVSSAGDVNGDGFGDLIIGATGGDPAGQSSAGESYVVFGKANGFGPSLNLSTLNGTNGFVINGIDASDLSGISVSSAGDVNGDGLGDLIIGATGGDPDGQSSAGESYVVFGKANGFTSSLNLSTLDGTTGFVINGIDVDDRSGISVSSAGDVNGDGFGDLIIGAYYADPAGQSNRGESYVLFGKANGFTPSLDLWTLDGTTGFVINGNNVDDRSGISVSSAGDINGDGFGDVIIGATGVDPYGQSNAGASYVVFGKASGFTSSLNLSLLNSTSGFRIFGIDAGDRSGISVSAAGDINGDGFDDLIIGAIDGDPAGQSSAGESYVVFGKASGFTSALNLSTLDGTNGFVISGTDASDFSGADVSSAGDVNGDGFADLIIGATGGDPNGQSGAGESYVIFGGNFTNQVTSQGTSAGESIAATASTDIIVAGQGNDSITGVASNDVVHGGQGNDSVTVTSLTFRQVDAGLGSDTLVLGGSDLILDLRTTSSSKLTGIEIVDLSTSANSQLTLNPPSVLNMAPLSNTLSVRGIAGNRVNLSGSWAETANQVDGGITYRVFISGQATLRVQNQTPVYFIEVSLSVLNGTNGFVINGIAPSDSSGWSVNSAGDINGDGFDDLIIGARFADPNGQSGAGESYVVLGKANGFTSSLNLSTLDGTNGFAIRGIDADDGSGISVSSAGDINGDGFDDVIIGSPYADPNNQSAAGESYVVFGKASGFTSILNLSTLDGTNGFVISGTDVFDLSGAFVSSAGDLNGDGFDDLIIGALGGSPAGRLNAGKSYVVFGKANGFTSSLDLSTLDGTNGFAIDGIDLFDSAGVSVGSAGDINGDGFDDLIIGARFADPDNRSSAGESYVIFGKASGFTSNLSLFTLDGTNGFVINGIDANDYSGGSVSSAGDVNGDGFDDLIIGASGGDPNGQASAGESYVVFGKASGFTYGLNLSTLDGTNGFVINGIDPNDFSGGSVHSVGDVNGDGFDDLIIGASGGDPNGQGLAGESYIIFGKANGFTPSLNLSSLNGTNGLLINGIDAGDFAGGFVSSAGDINGDGFDDLIIGATGGDPNGQSGAGESYVIFGGNFTSQVTSQGTSAGESITATANTDIIVAGQGNDTITGVSSNDAVHGGEGNDLIVLSSNDFVRVDGGRGLNTLRLGAMNLDLTTLGSSKLTNFGVIDLATEPSANSLTLSQSSVARLARYNNELVVLRNTNDLVNLGAGWTFETYETIGGQLFAAFRNAGTMLVVQTPENFYGGFLQPSSSNPALVDFVWLGGAGGNNVSFAFNPAADRITMTVTTFNGVAIGQTVTFFGVTGTVRLEGGASADTINAAGIGDLSLLGRSAPMILGGGGNNSIIGTPGPDSISCDGAEGSDTIDGGAGNDTIRSGGGADSVLGGLGNDNIVDGGEGNDTIVAGDGNDIVNAGDGNDNVDGGIGNDLIIGDESKAGNDTITGGSGRDILMGGLGADSLNGGTDEDILIAGDYSGADLALASIMAEWSSTRATAQRVANISGTGTGPRANAVNFLQVGTTVSNDNTLDTNNQPQNIVDIVLGGSTAGEIDWMFADNPVDTRPDFQVGVDILNDLSP